MIGGDGRRVSWGFAFGLAGVLVSGAIAGSLLFAPEIDLDRRSGDWRQVSEGLRRSRLGGALAAGPRAVIHLHALRSRPVAVRLSVSRRDASVPVRLSLRRDAHTLFDGPLASSAIRLEAPADARGSVDLFLEATPVTDARAPLYLIHEIVLERSFARWYWVARAVPALVGAVAFLLLWRGGARTAAVLWSVLAAGAAAGLLAVAADEPAWLQFRPLARERLRMVALAGLWGLSLASRPRPVAALAALWGTFGLLHLSTLDFGLVADDLLWAKPWSWQELLSTLWGSADPSGVTGAPYRPIPSWTRAADYWLWGFRTDGYHLTNLLIFGADGTLGWLLLLRLGLSARAALAGALCWVAHPLSATAATWTGQRTDTLMAAFYLAALLAILPPVFLRAHAVGAVILAALSLACKEMAATLPLAASLIARTAVPTAERRSRRATLFALAALVLVYACIWVVSFSYKLTSHGGRWRGFDPGQVEDWARLLPMLYGAIFVPTGYDDFWHTRFHDWSAAYLALAAIAPVSIVWLIRGCGSCRAVGRVAELGLIWPLVAVWPILGVRPDLYRLGLLLSLAFGVVFACLVQHVEHRAAFLPALLGIAVVSLFTPLSVAAAEAWGPGGFYWNESMSWSRQAPEWLDSLHPSTRRVFWSQLDKREHAARWVAELEQP